MKTATYFWLKFTIYLEKVPVMTNNTPTRAASFISFYAFWDINSIIFQHLYLTQLIFTNNHLRKRVDSIFCRHWKQLSLCHTISVIFSEVNHCLHWIWFSYSFHHNWVIICWSNKIFNFAAYFFILFQLVFHQ